MERKWKMKENGYYVTTDTITGESVLIARARTSPDNFCPKSNRRKKKKNISAKSCNIIDGNQIRPEKK